MQGSKAQPRGRAELATPWYQARLTARLYSTVRKEAWERPHLRTVRPGKRGGTMQPRVPIGWDSPPQAATSLQFCLGTEQVPWHLMHQHQQACDVGLRGVTITWHLHEVTAQAELDCSSSWAQTRVWRLGDRWGREIPVAHQRCPAQWTSSSLGHTTINLDYPGKTAKYFI